MLNDKYIDTDDLKETLLHKKLNDLKKFGFYINLEYDENNETLEYEIVKNKIRQYINVASIFNNLDEIINDFNYKTVNDARQVNNEIRDILKLYSKEFNKLKNRNE